jgi:alpha-glucoside transport system substrate-binding protein
VVDRRTLLRASVLTSAMATSGCAASEVLGLRPSVRVAVSWSGAERQAFLEVLARRPKRLKQFAVELAPRGDDISTALNDNTSGRADIVMLPRIGLLREHYRKLQPLPTGLRTALTSNSYFATRWRELLWFGRPAQPYGIPFKLAQKSLVWYRKDYFGDLTPPRTWDDWLALNKRLVRKGLTPLAVAGADGWPLTDYFENVLLGPSRDVYDKLQRHPEDEQLWEGPQVRTAFERLAAMWGMPGALAGGSRGALALQFPDDVLEVFLRGNAASVMTPDFAESVIRRFLSDRELRNVDLFRFPAVGPEQPLVVGGDIAVLHRRAGDEARQLVTWLAGKDAPTSWVQNPGGFIAGNRQVAPPAVRPEWPYSAHLREQVDELAGNEFPFDLSDQIGAVGDELGRVLQDFLSQLPSTADTSHLVDAAIDRMKAIGRRYGNAG